MDDSVRPETTALATPVAPAWHVAEEATLADLGAPEFTYTRRHKLRMAPHYVYVAHGALGYEDTLYVGQTHNPTHRLSTHRKQSEWWGFMRRVDFYRCATRTEALALERRLIRELRPRYNVMHALEPVARHGGIVA